MKNQHRELALRALDRITALGFIVVDISTGDACAAFLLPQDALSYIQWRCQREGKHGPSYDLINADGSPVSPVLSLQVTAANRGRY